MGQDSSVGIAARYGLDGPGIEFRWGRDFLQLSLGPTQPPVRWVIGSFPGLKQPRHGIDHPPPFSAEVKERVELYLYSPSGPSWPVLGWALPLPFMMLWHLDVVPGDSKEWGAFERLRATDTTTHPWKTWILNPKVHYHVNRSLLLVLKGNMFWKLDMFPFSDNRVERHLHTQLWQKKLFLFIGHLEANYFYVCVPSFGFCQQKIFKYIYMPAPVAARSKA